MYTTSPEIRRPCMTETLMRKKSMKPFVCNVTCAMWAVMLTYFLKGFFFI